MIHLITMWHCVILLILKQIVNHRHHYVVATSCTMLYKLIYRVFCYYTQWTCKLWYVFLNRCRIIHMIHLQKSDVFCCQQNFRCQSAEGQQHSRCHIPATTPAQESRGHSVIFIFWKSHVYHPRRTTRREIVRQWHRPNTMKNQVPKKQK